MYHVNSSFIVFPQEGQDNLAAIRPSNRLVYVDNVPNTAVYLWSEKVKRGRSSKLHQNKLKNFKKSANSGQNRPSGLIQ